MNISTEDKLKDLILQKYRSIREFTQVIDMPYSTFDTMLKRGINTATVSNVIKICKELGISADELAAGRIVHVGPKTGDESVEIADLVKDMKNKIISSPEVTDHGERLGEAEKIQTINALDVALEVGARNRKYTKKS